MLEFFRREVERKRIKFGWPRMEWGCGGEGDPLVLGGLILFICNGKLHLCP